MKHAVITTTIYPPYHLREWAKSMNEGDVIVVSGDLKTPHTEVWDVLEKIGNEFGIEVAYVAGGGSNLDAAWAVGPVIGWNSIQRRNIAILEAMKYKPDFITTVDTDNFPQHPADHLPKIRQVMTSKRHTVVESINGWYNVGEMVSPEVVHRGFPLSMRHKSPSIDVAPRAASIGVHASLWIGDPDIDAIERIHSNPETVNKAEDHFVLERNTWCPFNSQATTYRRELFPLLCVWPFIGRMDDIWPSYVARHIMNHFNWQVAYGAPFVIQERHPHDLVKDLENEIIGYRNTEQFVINVKDVDISNCETVIEALGMVTARVARMSFIPPALSLFLDKWHKDLNTLQSHYGVSFE